MIRLRKVKRDKAFISCSK